MTTSKAFISPPAFATLVLFLTMAVAALPRARAATDDWNTSTQEQWEAGTSDAKNVIVKNGMLHPTAKDAVFRSPLKRFGKKQRAANLTVKQSDLWQNWNPIPNIGPNCDFDSPVFLSLGSGRYWYFARYNGGVESKASDASPEKFVAKEVQLEGFDVPLLTTAIANQLRAPGGLNKSLGGYHAWESRDMINWVHHGPITDKTSGWMTTAEYVDGKAYFYYDFPNDQDPHLIIDDNLYDGKVGMKMGLAFKDPSHGSDCAFIRDKNGNFHVIYEDWSPIHPNRRSFDSPLAGHAISADGKGNFKILPPAVDHRTTPTGKTGTYNHPHWAQEDPENYESGEATYEIHEPEQYAYGDWSAICVGDQYYLFGDWEAPGKHPQHPSGEKGMHMRVGWFTTDSLDKEFEFCDTVGEGHPDPDICFAAGKFWLATQPETDFTSPGPWVEKVEVRVGVDISNDGKIDQWSDSMEVKESYDHTPGFVKHVQRTPAQLDLSSLPAAFGFQYELKITDTTANKSKPIIDEVSVRFK